MKIHERVLGMEEFLAVAEHGSFVAAAQVLGLTSSGVGKAVQKLEARLGVRLFTRTTRRVQLTQEGALFRERCQAVVRDLDNAEAEVDAQRSALDGLIRLNAPVAYGRLRIMSLVYTFMRMHPDVRIEAHLNDRLSNPVEERIDLLVRIGALEDSGMWARQIDTVRFGVFASKSYLKAHGTPSTPSDLHAHQRLGFLLNSGKALTMTVQNAEQRLSLPPTEQFICTDIEGTLSACEAGLGLAYLPTFIAEPSLESKTLQAVLPNHWVNGPPVHLICPQPRHVPRRVRALADHIVAALKTQSNTV
jgi:LysR family transcriptional regulator, regulator for bpeEF and oprC